MKYESLWSNRWHESLIFKFLYTNNSTEALQCFNCLLFKENNESLKITLDGYSINYVSIVKQKCPLKKLKMVEKSLMKDNKSFKIV